MRKNIVMSAVVVAIVVLTVSAWLVNTQFNSLQAQIADLQAQNNELENQNSTMQAQIRDLELQSRERQDRLTDFTHELAKVQHLRVEITAFTWVGGFNPIGGVTISHPVNVTVQNNDVIPVCGLTLTVRLLDKNLGTPIGTAGQSSIDRINAGESKVISGGALTTLNIDGSSSLNNAACVATLTVGSVVLDEWRYEL